MSEPWRPANGSEGLAFEQRWCNRCANLTSMLGGADDCEILFAAFLFDVDDKDYPKEWIEENGVPRCTAFKEAK